MKAAQTEKSPFLLYRMAGTWGFVAGGLLLAVSILNWTLLSRRGQTIGKIAAGTRVVMLDGTSAPFGKIVGLRTWVFHFPNYIPGLNRAAGVLSVVDALFVYRADRRCLHDLIAGTVVLSALAASWAATTQAREMAPISPAASRLRSAAVMPSTFTGSGSILPRRSR